MKQAKICISPIDWGLGHATRCVSLIKALEKLGYHIYIATEGQHETILREAIPTATFLHLRGYRIRYSRWAVLLPVVLLIQLPQIIYSIVYENKWLKKAQEQFNFDIIISDNRFGFYHKNVPSVFITHQLNLQMPFKWATSLFQNIQYAWLKKFNACWIPDIAGPQNLSGVLANPKLKPSIPLWYMGCLSRLINQDKSNITVSPIDPLNFLAIVSGPEPQRTLLENLLWTAGKDSNLKFVLIAGIPNNKKAFQIMNNGRMYPHLSAAALVDEINRAEYIICRGGYTTLMEMIPFDKKLILIPTPGQTEQLYLGKLWHENKWALCYNQADFKLSTALAAAANFNFQKPPFAPFSTEALETAIKELSL